eukprot:7766439-Heterocapsa_arctica.AAC.1
MPAGGAGPRAQRLLELRAWVSQHQATLRGRDGAGLLEKLRCRGGLPEEFRWQRFLSRNTFEGAQASE